MGKLHTYYSGAKYYNTLRKLLQKERPGGGDNLFLIKFKALKLPRARAGSYNKMARLQCTALTTRLFDGYMPFSLKEA